MITDASTAVGSSAFALPHFDLMPAAWYVLRTKPRQEKRAQCNLKSWGLETLLPLWPERRKNARAHECVRAVFPSYIFCRFRGSLFDKVKYTHGVSCVVSFGGKPAVVDQSIIDELASRMDDRGMVFDQPVAPALDALQHGDEVVIQSGPFANMTGVFDKEMSSGERVKILLRNVAARSFTCNRSDVRKV